jgi:hypothetical protein
VDVKVKIIAHEKLGDTSDLNRFYFSIEDQFTSFRINSITVQTARNLLSDIIPSTAFGQMIKSIARCEIKDYPNLVGSTYIHI